MSQDKHSISKENIFGKIILSQSMTMEDYQNNKKFKRNIIIHKRGDLNSVAVAIDGVSTACKCC